MWNCATVLYLHADAQRRAFETVKLINVRKSVMTCRNNAFKYRRGRQVLLLSYCLGSKKKRKKNQKRRERKGWRRGGFWMRNGGVMIFLQKQKTRIRRRSRRYMGLDRVFDTRLDVEKMIFWRGREGYWNFFFFLIQIIIIMIIIRRYISFSFKTRCFSYKTMRITNKT